MTVEQEKEIFCKKIMDWISDQQEDIGAKVEMGDDECIFAIISGRPCIRVLGGPELSMDIGCFRAALNASIEDDNDFYEMRRDLLESKNDEAFDFIVAHVLLRAYRKISPTTNVHLNLEIKH